MPPPDGDEQLAQQHTDDGAHGNGQNGGQRLPVRGQGDGGEYDGQGDERHGDVGQAFEKATASRYPEGPLRIREPLPQGQKRRKHRQIAQQQHHQVQGEEAPEQGGIRAHRLDGSSQQTHRRGYDPADQGRAHGHLVVLPPPGEHGGHISPLCGIGGGGIDAHGPGDHVAEQRYQKQQGHNAHQHAAGGAGHQGYGIDEAGVHTDVPGRHGGPDAEGRKQVNGRNDDAAGNDSTYTCEKVETKKVNNVNKEVWLYYTFTSTATFVVDFGLPLKIAPANVSANLSVAPIKTVQIAHSTKYADLSVDENKNIIYRLTKTIDGEDNITVRYTGTNASTDKIGEASFTLTIIPASNVYYEDSLATFTDGSGAASGADWKLVDSNGNENVTEDTTTTQALQQLGDKAIYGNDDAYNSSSKLSMGTAHKVTVTAAMLEAYNGGNTGNFAWPTAQFTFKGTGFDIISLTDNTSGAIVVDVYKGSKTEGSKPVHSYLVNNYYGYTYNQETKKWEVVKDGKENAIYQIPVMKVNDLPYGEYTAVVQVFYNSFFDENYDEKSENNQYSFWLDAVRIYDPMDEYAGYTQDHEGYPQYIKLHDEVVKEKATPNVNALFIDGKENATIAEYTSYGPNNEVYLMNGQAITFKIPQNANVDSIQIGAKAPDGNTTMTVTGTKDTVLATEALSTATEMYYKIDVDVSTADQTVVIANKDGTGILSLTNLKITYKTKPAENEKVTLAALDTQEQENAVNLVRALFTAPVATFSPETFEADWGRAVRAGKRATLTVKTSADVESITVDGQSITSYTTRTQRTGWGWWSPKVTYHVFTYTITAPAQTTDYAVCAVNAEGTASEAVTATLTVKPTTWWNWWF